MSQKIDCYFIVKIEISMLLKSLKFPLLKVKPDTQKQNEFYLYKNEIIALPALHMKLDA